MELMIDGYRIAYKETGAGEEVVVILQGWGTEYAVYDSIAACINSDYRVIQFDFPGFGNSDEPREAWNVDAYASFFCSLMERLGVSKAALIGHSYGGRVIIKLTGRQNLPFEITNIVLIDSAGILPEKSFSQKMRIKRYRLLKRIFNIKWLYGMFPELIDVWRNRQGSEDYRNATPVMRQCLVMAVNEDLSALLPGIRQDTLLIWGDQDTATPISDAKLMEKSIPNAGLVILPGAGHFSFLEQPVLIDRVLKSYFKIGVKDED